VVKNGKKSGLMKLWTKEFQHVSKSLCNLEYFTKWVLDPSFRQSFVHWKKEKQKQRRTKVVPRHTAGKGEHEKARGQMGDQLTLLQQCRVDQGTAI